MANVNKPFGLLPIGNLGTGAPFNGELMNVPMAYDTAAIYRGDPVAKLASGYVGVWTPSSTAVSQLAGIFWGCEFLSAFTGKMESSAFWPGSGTVASSAQNTIVAKIIPCNLAVPGAFVIQSDATGIAFADIGRNCDVALGTGNTLNGQSGAYINSATLNDTATLPFRIKSLYGGAFGAGGVGGIQPGSTGPYSGSATGAYNWVVVQANVSGAGSTGLN